jgi:hypothetical protein
MRKSMRVPGILLGLAIVMPAGVFASPAAAAAEKPGRPLEVTVCSITHTDKDAEAKLDLLKGLGVTSIQTYIFWNKVEKTPGLMDWSEYDADAALFKKHGIRWVPFIIAGPWYVTPDFVRADPQMVMLRCLEHGRDSAIPSIWCERLRGYVRTYLQKFAEHFRPMDVLESINLGISGDYGEAIYSVLGNWPGEYHSHGGYWCGDALAAADFRKAMGALYPGGVEALNKAWGTRFSKFEDLAPFLPDKAPSERAWQEELRWYRAAMTAHADFWMKTAREFFPDTEIYLCTGGDMAPEHGSDFIAQARVAAQYRGGIRITNESSSFPMNVRLTRMVDAACRFYGAYFGHEPASAVTPAGMLGRLFNAVTAGARQVFLYNTLELMGEAEGRPVLGEGGKFHRDYAEFQKTMAPVVDVALYHPQPWSRETGSARQDFSDLAARVRRFVDYDFLDDRLILDGALTDKSVLILAGASILDAAVLTRIERWVNDGGVLFVLGCRPPDWDGSRAAFDALVGFTAATDEIQGITEMVAEKPKVLPSIAALSGIFLTRAYTGLADDIRPQLSMRYAPQGKGAWRRKAGKGELWAYYGPMDMRQLEQDWVVAQNVPLRFLQDGIRASVGAGILKKEPGTLNLTMADLFLVETTEGLWALNMGTAARSLPGPAVAVEIPPLSIRRVR